MKLLFFWKLTRNLSYYIYFSGPNPPSNFRLVNSTSHTLALRWTQEDNTTFGGRSIESFDITYRPINANINDAITINVQSNQITLKNLSSNTEYNVTLTGVATGLNVYIDSVSRIFQTGEFVNLFNQ